ncbi:MAG: IS1634 family transposase [Clostridiales bacterium]|nr:IS1634 family transposase [Clostridiales bacterium]
MYVRKCFNKKTGRTQLSIVQGYRDSSGKVKQKIILNLGYLDVLQQQHDDPIKYCEDLARQMTEEYNNAQSPVRLEIDPQKTLDLGADYRHNFGYAVLSAIYHELEIDDFFQNRQRMTQVDFNYNSIFRELIFSRLIAPASKKASYEYAGHFFERADFSLTDVYRSLSFFKSYQSALQLWIHEHIRQNYGRDTSLVYYDVTNYYFEVDIPNEMLRKGVSKEHRPDPIVQMGLFMDTNGIPISYGLFSGNTLDKQTLIPMMGKLQDEYSLGRIIIVADRGMITGDNICQTLSDGNGYILSYSIAGSTKEFKDYVLDEEGYVVRESGFKIKSRLTPREIHVTNVLTGKKQTISVDEKHVVFYSPDYAKRAKAERAEVLQKAKDLIQDPQKYNRSTSYGAAKYVKNIAFNKDTGEIYTDSEKSLELNDALIAEEEKYDGYYAIITSEHEMEDEKILNIYRGLWQIEETFKITKSELETRPVYLKKLEHIQAHFLICFTALVIAKLLEFRMKRKYSVSTILKSLRRCECSLLEQNIYLFDYYDEVLRDIGEEFHIDFSRKYRTLGEIKKVLGEVKKGKP